MPGLEHLLKAALAGIEVKPPLRNRWILRVGSGASRTEPEDTAEGPLVWETISFSAVVKKDTTMMLVVFLDTCSGSREWEALVLHPNPLKMKTQVPMAVPSELMEACKPQ